MSVALISAIVDMTMIPVDMFNPSFACLIWHRFMLDTLPDAIPVDLAIIIVIVVIIIIM